MLDELNAFYVSQGISPHDFRCLFRPVCSARDPDAFIEASASYVGPLYEERRLPRLLFLSLDPPDAHRSPRKRTAEAGRLAEFDMDISELPKNRHWYLTHELAFTLLRRFKADIEHPRHTRPYTPRHLHVASYFAHVNSVKCCQRPGKGKADPLLFKMCRTFIPGELEVLSPDVIVTQGKEAQTAIDALVSQREVKELKGVINPRTGDAYKLPARYETGFLKLRSRRRTLWIQTYLPNNYGRFNPQRIRSWPLYAEKVEQFWASRSG